MTVPKGLSRVFKAAAEFLFDVQLLLVTYFPGKIGIVMRRSHWKKRCMYIGPGAVIDIGVHFQNPRYISIGANTWIDKGVIILAGPDESDRARRVIRNEHYVHEGGTVFIGENVHIAPYCVISGIGGVHIADNCNIASGAKMYSFSHHYRSDDDSGDRSFCFGPNVPANKQYLIEGPIFLAENVGVAVNVVVLPGVAIGRDSFVAIGSVVRSSFGQNSFIAGNPAVRERARFSLR
jgi:acetyltransferase-like isoleucine patch superfamily enzyme